MNKKVTIRNYVVKGLAHHRGGIHIKSKSGQRAKQRQDINQNIDEWLCDDKLNPKNR